MDRKVVNNIKCLGIDMINKANSGHPGIVLGAASIIYTIYARHLNINVNDPFWDNRDRFVLSAGHGSALLYSTLYMAGFIDLDEIKRFRRINSLTPGHPEYGVTKGVDMTTGLLGQGFATSVGMALAGKILNKKYELPKKSKLGESKSLYDYYVYTLCSDGDLMEGVSYEAASLAGSLKLNNLIVLYDSNGVTLDGETNGVFDEDILKRFDALNWNTIFVKDGNSIYDIDKAIIEAKKSDKPTLIQVKTVSGEDSIYENTNKAHGIPLKEGEITSIKLKLGVNTSDFYVDKEAQKFFQKLIKERGLKKYNNYLKLKNSFQFFDKKLSINYDFDYNLKEEMRVTNGKIMQNISKIFPNFIGGSADLGSSTKAYLNNNLNNFVGNNINFGVREHAMGAILNGLSLCGFHSFGSTFLAFSDYLKPAIRLTALMNLPVTYIFTHDSINIGQDGPTHQPIEQLNSLRMIPNMNVFRPCDVKEIIGSWEYIINNKIPSCLVLSRNKVGVNKLTDNKKIKFGGYIVRKERKLHAIIISTGSEVELAIKIADELNFKYKIDIRVVSMPNRELFLNQSLDYQDEIIPKGYRVIVIEAGSKYGWEGFVYNSKYLITINEFGFSGTEEEVLDKMNFSYEKIKNKVLSLLK